MKKTPAGATPTVEELSTRIDQLEASHHALEEALKLLLPLAFAVPATSGDSAQAVKSASEYLKQAQASRPRSDQFWDLASAMMMVLSSRAASQHPGDPEVIAIFQGLREHRRH